MVDLHVIDRSCVPPHIVQVVDRVGWIVRIHDCPLQANSREFEVGGNAALVSKEEMK